MKPLIGVTCQQEDELVSVTRYYGEALMAAGGLPVLLPVTLDRQVINAYGEMLDGLLLSGGGDLDPSFFGEEPLRGLGTVCPQRDIFELELCKLFLAAHKPVLGICRGLQVLNVALGGTLFQDLRVQYPASLEHQQKAPKNWATHRVAVETSSLLREILAAAEIRVNSFHHQGIKALGRSLRAVAWAADGVIEGVERETGFAVGVQWHPERLWETHQEQKQLFDAFVEEARRIKSVIDRNPAL
ncbi:MAG TPA: gamma-glutamyl-gamma-aminobutyrate hydrolase family protein [Clostridia bacterium]|nr:gamma-glutamyl-gamma-aminobutyrate hydrolase family protein [Clostridia bacterium]